MTPRAVLSIELAARGLCREYRPIPTLHDTEQAIRALPGGEAWLVGLVLPEGTDYCSAHKKGRKWGCGRCNFRLGLPARLAILAPEPPPLLEERVRSWGGEVWLCSEPRTSHNESTGLCNISLYHESISRALAQESSWLEAVRAALGEEIVPSGAGGITFSDDSLHDVAPASTPRFRPLDDGRWLEVREPEVAS